MTTSTKLRRMSFHPSITITILAAAALGALASEAAPSEQQQHQQQLQQTTTTTTAQATTTALTAPQINEGERVDNSTRASFQPKCQLGNDTYQLGERWNPNLPPFGVQVCVLCECIARERKNTCYEAKVICRRITNECPKLDSCPDGKKPVTTPGQCCKSCQNDAGRTQVLVDTPTQPPMTAYATGDRLSMYKNDRIKDPLDISKLPACPVSKPDQNDSRSNPNSASTSSSTKYKGQNRNGAKNELNAIDSRKLFKWLDNERSVVTNSNGGKISNAGGRTNQPVANTGDESNQQQHPNDVQSGLVNFNHVSYQEPATTSRPHTTTTTTTTTRPYNSSNMCILGSDTFLVGERWNPVLPPNGVQVCVLCNCIVRVVRRACYEPKVVCKRINGECPVIKLCPDGKKPVAMAGQCCKSCQSTTNESEDHQQEEPNFATNTLTLTTTTSATVVTSTVMSTHTHNPELPSKSNPNSQATSDRATSETIIRIMSHYPSCSAHKNQQREPGGGGGGSRTNSSATATTASLKRSIRLA